uniref:Fc receptor, IgE, high affinity I, gamma polypeptide like n=1 Tax=Astatotilapia calliptera TaxID=8154 RepID=A0A3P8NQM9_ASTCA
MVRALIALFLILIEGMDICFILDGILILYGIILTVLYCRLRVRQTGTTHTDRHDGLLLILMLKNIFKMAHDGKVTAHCTVDVFLFYSSRWLSQNHT